MESGPARDKCDFISTSLERLSEKFTDEEMWLPSFSLAHPCTRSVDLEQVSQSGIGVWSERESEVETETETERERERERHTTDTKAVFLLLYLSLHKPNLKSQEINNRLLYWIDRSPPPLIFSSKNIKEKEMESIKRLLPSWTEINNLEKPLHFYA